MTRGYGEIRSGHSGVVSNTRRMAIEFRTATAEDAAEMFHVDGRNFGTSFTDEEIAERMPVMEWERMHIALDRGRIVSAVGVATLDIGVPGGATLPMGGVTWVSTAATHRRMGLMRTLIDSAHADAAERGEPMTGLGASEASIYGRFGYGTATFSRQLKIAARGAQLHPTMPDPGGVRFESEVATIRKHVEQLWERSRQRRAGEVSRSSAWWDLIMKVRSRAEDSSSPAFWLLHDEGYAAYRVEEKWDDAAPNHHLDVVEMVTLSTEADAALWRVLLSIDLMSTIATRALPFDHPLPYWLANQRAVRTTSVTDWVWLRPIDPARVFAGRTYGAAGRLVIDVAGQVLAIDAPIADAPAVVTSTSDAPDLTIGLDAVAPLLMGSVDPFVLAAAGRIRGDVDALRRAKAMCATDLAPYGQMMF
jgi:predicted acetyltransferase